MTVKIQAASAIIPAAGHRRSVELIAAGVADPVLGPISMDEVQLCPQHAGRISDEMVDELMETYPGTRFRLHAVPKCAGTEGHRVLDAVNVFDEPKQLERMAALSRRMKAPGYSIHAGKTAHGTLDQAFDNVRRLADVFGCRVGIEGLYPSAGKTAHWLLGTWAEHERLLEAEVDFAIDLSHLNIVAKREKVRRDDLVLDLLGSPHCIEVHVSCNDGRADSHRPLNPDSPPWWLPFLASVRDDAVVFYEGVLRDPHARG